ncbi:MAG TPA: hypothetical protein VLM85_05245 [Polyangiaceae bacterium]|nr:hypothetical protein [Polyangiaceae bacterium]
MTARKIGAVLAATAVACAGAASKPPPTPTAPVVDASPVARVARQCALVASCSREHQSSVTGTPQACVDWYLVNAHDEAPLADCMMKAKDCAGLEACSRARADTGAEEYCTAHPGVLTACDGNRFISCEGEGGSESLAVDCAALGGTCGETKQGGVALRGCLSPRLCPDGAPEHRCDGDGAVVDCAFGIAERNVCPPSSRCSSERDESGAPVARCRSTSGGRDCTLGGAAFCEGDVAYSCVQSGRFRGLHAADCGAFGLGCAVRSGRVFCVGGDGAGCSGGAASCAGDTLAFCAAGRQMHVSCKELGFAGCDPGAGGEALCAVRR